MAGFGGSVKLVGETEYKKALKSITQGLREVSSEMKLVTAQYASNDKNTAALANKSADLAKKLDEQKKAIANLRDSYKTLAGQYDAQKQKTADLQKAYDSEKAKLDQIKATLGTSSSAYKEQAAVVDKLEQELKESTQTTEAMGNSLQTMRVQLNNAETSIVKTQNTLDGLNEELAETPEEAGKASKGIDEVGDASEQTEKKFSLLKNAAVTTAKIMAAAMAAAAAGAVALGKAAIENYANYEQLVGGVDTLFKEGSNKVQEYAANAYKTAGVSANQYMETVTGFSASLISSLGGDTVKAADYANRAITDMSDNANKMGTDIESIQYAYQGFAKQNYTMLDNLKLG